MKKFKELQDGDVVWCLNKMEIKDGIKKLTVSGKEWEWCEGLGGEWRIDVKGEGYFSLIIPKSSFGKCVSSQLYTVFATDRDILLKASGKFILKYAENLDKRIQEAKKNIVYLESLREKVDKLLVQV